MGNKARSSITVNSSTLGSHAITTLTAADITVSDSITTESLNANSLTTNNLNTQNLVVNGNDVTQVLQSGGSLNATSLSGTSAAISDTLTAGNVITNSTSVMLATGTLNSNTMTVDLNTVQQPGSYTQSSIVNPSPNSHVGFICVSLIDTNSTGSIALYTRGKMWNLTVYTVIFEKNTNTDSTVSLNTDSGALTISTTRDITFEIKALNLFEK